jgi:hypothetical protein
MQGSTKRNLHMFRKLCGNDALSRVVLATTMWEDVDELKGAQREKKLSETEEYWGVMMRNGSQVRRHYNTRESALELLSYFVTSGSKTSDMVLDIQAQMVDQGKSLDETAAGMELQAELIRERKKNEATIAELEAKFRQAQEENNLERMKELEEEKRERQDDKRKFDRDNAALKATVNQLKRDRAQQYAEIQRQLKMAEQRDAETQRQLKMAEQRDAETRRRLNKEKQETQRQMKMVQERNAKLEHDNRNRKESERRFREAQEAERQRAERARLQGEDNKRRTDKLLAEERRQLEAYRAQQSRVRPSPTISPRSSNSRTEPRGPTLTVDIGEGPVEIPPTAYTREGNREAAAWDPSWQNYQRQKSIRDSGKQIAEDKWSSYLQESPSPEPEVECVSTLRHRLTSNTLHTPQSLDSLLIPFGTIAGLYGWESSPQMRKSKEIFPLGNS